ncbi:hypothetical protein FB567DRAFT_209872 [Paraphoma chrysanthemicola]|uniref:Uncharacterized protein n=1 Tax=Paraphoma chrysanthemicola TaxID=798071 RepID=A0A8K0QWL6_9PLEO|nr:hypothetical protein FB567DRAFT_209872 [Paraphoma chrysanthemicola]
MIQLYKFLPSAVVTLSMLPTLSLQLHRSLSTPTVFYALVYVVLFQIHACCCACIETSAHCSKQSICPSLLFNLAVVDALSGRAKTGLVYRE